MNNLHIKNLCDESNERTKALADMLARVASAPGEIDSLKASLSSMRADTDHAHDVAHKAEREARHASNSIEMAFWIGAVGLAFGATAYAAVVYVVAPFMEKSADAIAELQTAVKALQTKAN